MTTWKDSLEEYFANDVKLDRQEKRLHFILGAIGIFVWGFIFCMALAFVIRGCK